ncbi:unnamed protein product [Symbiodinium sp. CCMP2456]|nr:unnamed protein product [Symbiodinium sp. CCMP2456]
MVCDSGMNVDIAVALFEKGYAEASVQEAIKSCSTLEEAMSFLNPKHKQTKVHDSTVQGAGDRPRRRATGKKAQTGSVAGAPCTGPTETSAAEQVPLTVGNSTLLQRVMERQPKSKTCEELSASAAPTPSETVSSGDSVAAPTPVEPEKPSADAAEAMEAVEVSMEAEEAPPPPPVPVRSIEPNEHGMKWWREAAARWPKIYQNLRLEASLSILRPECREVTDYLGSVHFGESANRTPVRKRTMEEQASTNGKKKRQEGASAMGVLPTPSRSSNDGCRSPQAMRLNSNADVCKICCCDTSPWRSVRLGCGHGWYCASCMLRHAEARLEMGAASITCPECSSVLAERDLRKLLPTETIDRLLARSLEQAVSSSANIRACPTPNCVMRVAIEEGDITKFKCTICKKESCLRCGRQPFHRGMTCEEYAEKLKNSTRAAKKERQADQLFEQWMEKTGSKQCPTCRMAVTKQNLDKQKTQYSECHKMSCRNCGTKFCFKCLAILTDSYTCGCTIDAHGFIDPVTGKIVKHLKKRAKK